jgi:hypothetical protein
MKLFRHTLEQVVRKLREPERLIGEGTNQALRKYLGKLMRPTRRRQAVMLRNRPGVTEPWHALACQVVGQHRIRSVASLNARWIAALSVELRKILWSVRGGGIASAAEAARTDRERIDAPRGAPARSWGSLGYC